MQDLWPQISSVTITLLFFKIINTFVVTLMAKKKHFYFDIKVHFRTCTFFESVLLPEYFFIHKYLYFYLRTKYKYFQTRRWWNYSQLELPGLLCYFSAGGVLRRGAWRRKQNLQKVSGPEQEACCASVSFHGAQTFETQTLPSRRGCSGMHDKEAVKSFVGSLMGAVSTRGTRFLPFADNDGPKSLFVFPAPKASTFNARNKIFIKAFRGHRRPPLRKG